MPGDILGYIRVRIFDPWEKIPLEKFLKFYFGLKHPKKTTQERGVRSQVPLSLSKCALLLSRNARLFPDFPLYFPEVPFCFLELPFCFPEVPFLLLKNARLFSRISL